MGVCAGVRVCVDVAGIATAISQPLMAMATTQKLSSNTQSFLHPKHSMCVRAYTLNTSKHTLGKQVQRSVFDYK